MKKPTTEQVRKAREAAELNQEQAAELIYKHKRSWFKYESGERQMDAALFELFLFKTGQKDIGE